MCRLFPSLKERVLQTENVCPSVCPGSKEHYRPGRELRDELMPSGVIRYGKFESGVSLY